MIQGIILEKLSLLYQSSLNEAKKYKNGLTKSKKISRSDINFISFTLAHFKGVSFE